MKIEEAGETFYPPPSEEKSTYQTSEAPERKGVERGIGQTPEARQNYLCHMAEIRMHAAERGLPRRAQRPPPWQLRGDGNEPTNHDSESDGQEEPDDMAPQAANLYSGMNSAPAPLAGNPYTLGPENNILDRDYACQAAQVQQARLVPPLAPQVPQQPVQQATPMPPQVQQQHGRSTAVIAPQQVQYAAPLLAPAPMPGMAHFDHEADMIDKLLHHIQGSLVDNPATLPEIKGLRVRLPDAYQGEDDFDLLNKWLQGLLRFFKLYCLMGRDRDPDCILLTGQSLKGKAECWFSQEVEQPTQIICDWTFESTIVGLFHTFITTATAQQAI